MTSFATKRILSALLISSTTLALAACGSTGTTRIASVGQVPPGAGSGGAGGTDGGTGSGGTGTGSGNTGSGNTGGSGSGGTGNTGGNGTGGGTGDGGTGGGGVVSPTGAGLLVSAGNAVIGLAGQHNAIAETVDHLVPAGQPVTGTVTAILRDTGQTLVDLGNGKSVAVQSAAGIVGEVVKIDLGNLKVVSAPDNSSLLGVGVATPQPVTGTLASLNVTTGNTAVTGLIDQTTAAVVGVVAPGSSIPAKVDQAIAPVVTTVTSVLDTATAPLASGATSPVDGVVSTVAEVASNPVGAIAAAPATVTGALAPVETVVATVVPVVQNVVDTVLPGAQNPVGGVVPVVQNVVNTVLPGEQNPAGAVVPVVQNVVATVVPVAQTALNTTGTLPVADIPAIPVVGTVAGAIGGAVGVTTGQVSAGPVTATTPGAGASGVLGLGGLLRTGQH